MLNFLERMNAFAENNDLEFWFRYRNLSNSCSEFYFFNPKTGRRRDYSIMFDSSMDINAAAHQIISDVEHNFLKKSNFH